jgi:autotransporter translocation and assembly factor TamB
VARTGWGRRRILALARDAIAARVDGEVRIGQLGGDLNHVIVLHEVAVDGRDARPAFGARRIVLRYSLPSLLWGRITVGEAAVDGGWVDLHRGADGRWNLAGIFRPGAPGGKSRPLAIDRVSGTVAFAAPWLRARTMLSGKVRIATGHSRMQLDRLDAAIDAPVAGTLGAEGAMRIEGRELRFDRVHAALATDGESIEEWHPGLGLHGPQRATVDASGTLAGLAVAAEVRPVSGKIAIDGGFGIVGKTVRANATIHGDDLDPGAISARFPSGTLSLDADGELAGRLATLRVHRLAARGAGASLRAEGTIDSRGRGAGDASVTVGEIADLAPFLPGLAGTRGALAVRARATRDRQLRIDLTLDGKRLTRRDLHVGKLHLALRGTEGEAHLDAAAEGLRSGKISVAAAQIDWHGRARFRGRTPAGADGTIDRLGLTLAGERWQTTGAARLTVGEAASLERLQLASGAQRLALDGTIDRRTRSIAGRLLLSAIDPRPLAALAGANRVPAATVDGTIDLSGRLTAPIVDGDLHATLTEAPLAGTRIALRARAADRRARGQLDATSGQARATARFDLPLARDGAIAAKLDTQGVDLLALRPFLPPRLAELSGQLTLSATASGTRRAPIVEARATVRNWRLTGDPGIRNCTTLTAHYRDGLIDAESSTSFAGGGNQGRVDLAGRGRLSDGALHLTLDARKLARAHLFDHLDAHATLDWAQGQAHLVADSALAGAPLLHADGATAIAPRQLRDGTWRKLPFSVAITLPHLDLVQLRRLRPELHDLSGILAGSARLDGTLDQPSASAHVTIARLAVGPGRFGALTADARGDRDRLHFTVAAEQTGGGRLHGNGDLPRDPAQPIHLAAQASRLDLAFLSGAIPFVGEARGRIDFDLTAAGTRRDPQVAGTVALENGSFRLRDEPRLYDHLTLRASAAGGRVTLARLYAATDGGGTLEAHGAGRFVGLLPAGLDLSIDAHRFPLIVGTHAAWLDAKLAIHADSPAPGKVAGRVTVERGTLHAPRIEGGRKLQAIGPLDRVTFTDARARRERAGRPPPEKPLTVDATLSMPGPFHVRSRELRLDLNGQVQLSVRGRELQLHGDVEGGEGTIELIGQRYAIERARATWNGAPSDPYLDVRMTRQVRDSTLIIEVRGTIQKPQLEVRSEPPVYDRSQVVGLILSGDPSAPPVADSTVEQKVTGAVSGLILGRVTEAILPALPIDVVHIETGSGEGYAGLGQAHLEIGKYLGKQVYLSYTHQFGQTATATIAGTAVVNSNQANIEYRITHNLRLETSFGDASVGGLELYWSVRY